MMKETKCALKIMIVMQAILLIAFLIILLVCNRVFLAEATTLMGAIDYQEDSEVGTGFRFYIESTEEEREQFYSRGKEILKEAGYSYSSGKYIVQNIASQLVPVCIFFFALVFFSLLIGWAIIHNAMSEISTKEIEFNNAQKQIVSLKRETKKKLQEIDEFEENLYHQLKSALTSLQLCFDQLSTETDFVARSHSTYSDIQIQLQKLSRLITLFLRDRKLANNIVKFRYRLEALDEIVESAIAHLTRYAMYHNISLRLDIINGQEFYIHCDSNWVSECIVTLVENSIEHSSAGTEVLITMQQRNKNYVIAIQSHGDSIPDGELGAVFNRFYSSKVGHFGIGLHMAKTIIENHHGRITIQNNIAGDGVTFEIILPMIDQSTIYD